MKTSHYYVRHRSRRRVRKMVVDLNSLTQRRRFLEVTPEFLVEIMKEGTDPEKPRFLLSINDPLPADTKLISANIASEGKSVFMVIESESFEISGQKVPQHLPIPTVTAHYQAIPDDEETDPPHVTNGIHEEPEES